MAVTGYDNMALNCAVSHRMFSCLQKSFFGVGYSLKVGSFLHFIDIHFCDAVFSLKISSTSRSKIISIKYSTKKNLYNEVIQLSKVDYNRFHQQILI